MKPHDALFDGIFPKVEAVTPQLIQQEQARRLITDLTTLARDESQTTSLTGVNHVRMALNRETWRYGVSLPQGAIYGLDAYDEFTQSVATDRADLELEGMTYASRLLVVTGDESNRAKKPKLKKFFEQTFGETPSVNQTILLLHTVFPQDAKNVRSVQNITFAAVLAPSGESRFFTLEPNPNYGGVYVEYAMIDEGGEMRDRAGSIDCVNLKALPCDGVRTSLMLEELQKAHEVAKSRKKMAVPNEQFTNSDKKLRDIGKNALSHLRNALSNANR